MLEVGEEFIFPLGFFKYSFCPRLGSEKWQEMLRSRKLLSIISLVYSQNVMEIHWNWFERRNIVCELWEKNLVQYKLRWGRMEKVDPPSNILHTIKCVWLLYSFLCIVVKVEDLNFAHFSLRTMWIYFLTNFMVFCFLHLHNFHIAFYWISSEITH